MKQKISTPYGTVSVGTVIRIKRINDSVEPSPAFPDGIDHQAREYNGRTETVTLIDDAGQIHGTWGGLALNHECDEFEIINETPKVQITVTEEQRNTLLVALRNRQDLLNRSMCSYSMQKNEEAVKDCLDEIKKAGEIIEILKTK